VLDLPVLRVERFAGELVDALHEELAAERDEVRAVAAACVSLPRLGSQSRQDDGLDQAEPGEAREGADGGAVQRSTRFDPRRLVDDVTIVIHDADPDARLVILVLPIRGRLDEEDDAQAPLAALDEEALVLRRRDAHTSLRRRAAQSAHIVSSRRRYRD
jgi:hypothetical protein